MKSLFAIVAIAAAMPALAGEAARTTVLDVQNMTCASCPLTVRQVLKNQPGVQDAKVSLEKHSAEVKFDPSKAQPEQLANAVSEAGFPTTVKK